MIPVKPFMSMCFCDRHRDYMEHEIFFMGYNPKTQQVTYQAICVLCDMELENEKDVIGFVASMHASQWDTITPIEDELLFS